MADKIAKLLAKLPKKQLQLLLNALAKINQGNLYGLDIKSLKGRKNRYRVRVGNHRIIFTINKQSQHTVLLIAKRKNL